MSKDVDQRAAETMLPAESIDRPMKLTMCKRGSLTYYTLEADADQVKGYIAAFGTKNPDFFFGLLQQVVNSGSKGQYPDEQGIKFMLGFIKSTKPSDEVEAAFSAQIAACQLATMSAANRLAHAESLLEQDSAERAFNKLARTFAALVEALQRYRACGEGKVFMHNVAVSDGGRAIVGNVPPRRRGRPAPPAARQSPLEIASEPQQASVPLRRRQQG